MTGEFTIAVHAIVFLNHKDTILSSETIAENVCTNAARIRKVMAKLKKANIVKTKEGLEGGYYLCENAGEIDLANILEALGESPVCVNWKTGNPDKECLISSGMEAVMEDIYADMNAECIKKLRTIQIKDIDVRIQKNGVKL